MKLHLSSLLLQIKLTAIFIIFGLLIGLSSYFISTVSTTKIVIDTFLNRNLNPITQLSKNKPSDWIYDLFTNSEDTQASRDFLKDVIPDELKDTISLKFYYKNRETGKWYLMKDTAAPRLDIKQIGIEDSKELEEVMQSDFIASDHSFFNFAQIHSLLMNETRKGDSVDFVVKTEINRENLLDYFIKKKDQAKPFLIITLAISLIAGAFFSRTITKPVRELTRKAVSFSKGDLTVRFSAKRKDDIGELYKSMDSLAVNISNRITTIQTMNKIDRAVNSSLSRNELIKRVVGFIHNQFPVSIQVVFEKFPKEYRIVAMSQQGLFPANMIIPAARFPKKFIENNSPVFTLSDKILGFLDANLPYKISGYKGISIPLKVSEHIAGYFVFASDTISERDRETLLLLADQVGVALHSLKETEERALMYEGMLVAFSRSIDAKSKWTAGHSERVAIHAVTIAKALGLGKKMLQEVRIGALLHDIGKLGVPEKILDKPEKLTDAEYKMIKNHPLLGVEIIEDVPNFEQIRFAVLYHHEHWNGSGYPEGIKKDSIPLIARIITVADVWDAITADRPYRTGYSKEKSFNIMREERGTLFDPALVDLFLKIV